MIPSYSYFLVIDFFLSFLHSVSYCDFVHHKVNFKASPLYTNQGRSQDFRIEGARNKGDCARSARKVLNWKPHPLIKSRVHVYAPFELSNSS
jgi:hypothetical protein